VRLKELWDTRKKAVLELPSLSKIHDAPPASFAYRNPTKRHSTSSGISKNLTETPPSSRNTNGRSDAKNAVGQARPVAWNVTNDAQRDPDGQSRRPLESPHDGSVLGKRGPAAASATRTSTSPHGLAPERGQDPARPLESPGPSLLEKHDQSRHNRHMHITPPDQQPKSVSTASPPRVETPITPPVSSGLSDQGSKSRSQELQVASAHPVSNVSDATTVAQAIPQFTLGGEAKLEVRVSTNKRETSEAPSSSVLEKPPSSSSDDEANSAQHNDPPAHQIPDGNSRNVSVQPTPPEMSPAVPSQERPLMASPIAQGPFTSNDDAMPSSPSPMMVPRAAANDIRADAKAGASLPRATSVVIAPALDESHHQDAADLNVLSKMMLSWLDNSCSYDAVTAILGLLSLDEPHRMHQIQQGFRGGPSSPSCPIRDWSVTINLDHQRDSLRRWLNQLDEVSFRDGDYAAVSAILNRILDPEWQTASDNVRGGCRICKKFKIPLKLSSLPFCSPEKCPRASPIPWMPWLTRWYSWETNSACECQDRQNLIICDQEPNLWPEFLWFEAPQNATFTLSAEDLIVYTSKAAKVAYRVAGIVYSGGAHFTARYIDRHGKVWYHDSKHRPTPLKEADIVANISKLSLAKGRVFHGILYVRKEYLRS
jgi:hypothetical protein